MRIQGRGLVDGNTPIKFRFDGQWVKGFAGDTVASALLGQGIRLMGRSFKYHRPRGPMTAGSDDPSALVTVGRGADQRPNTRATMQEIWEGLDVRSQSAWPSLKWDAMEINDLASPFLAAGFYYKTFMWPPAFWEKIYEPIIRRAAGLGSLSRISVEDRSEKAFAHCDVLVIGAGPTGLMAALAAGQAGADVIVADESTMPGGRLLSETIEVGGKPGADWAADMTALLSAMPNVRMMTRTTVTGAYDQGTYGALERVALHVPDGAAPPECFWRIYARHAVLAAGAIERGIAFPSNDRPGIMLAGAARSYLNRWGVSPGKRVVVFGNNDDAHRTAADYSAAGVNVVALVDTRSGIRMDGPWQTYDGAEVIGTSGRLGLRSVTVRQGGRTHALDADCLAISGGWNPAIHLTCHLNARPDWREDIAAFVPKQNAVPGLYPAGSANGVFSTHDCLADGLQAANAIIDDLGRSQVDIDVPSADDAPFSLSPVWQIEAPGRAWLDLQNDVTTKDIRLAAQENFRSVEHMKRYTTQGMATDQGKGSNINALAVLADATGRTISQTGTTTYRPPYVPVSISAMGAGARGAGFAPERFTTSDDASRRRNAPMTEAGLWYRASYYPESDEQTWRDSCDREVRMVREAVGISDVTTLGKIDIQGPDAGRFLDFVYTNTFSSLRVGRVRYGLMLREDGHVMDDGTCARLSEQRYLMTTTTAAAGNVMSHLEFVRQALRPDLGVKMTSVTEQWAQFAVAGPKAFSIIQAIADEDISDGEWPFMSCGSVTIGDVSARLFRISFSGERGYEIAVPARYGEALYLQLLAVAETHGGGPFGMEALNVLRIEKGFITHAEIHGRTTPYDIGMQGMMSGKKDFIGKALAARPGLMDPSRERLVGLRPVDPDARITAGAHLFDEGARATRENNQGYLTSVCYSPTIQSYIALGFLQRGPERLGERLRLVDHLSKIDTTVEVVRPTFFDPDAERMRG